MKETDATMAVGKAMTLELKEVRGSSSTTTFKEGYAEVGKDTRTYFHWKLRGIASKLDPKADDFDVKGQEVYFVIIASEMYDIGFAHGFKSREDAIRQALAFADRNGMEVDGYECRAK